MIVVAQCLRHRIVDSKGAGAIDQLRSSSRIARTCASRLRMNEGQRCLGDLDAKLGRYVGISHDAQQELEWRCADDCGRLGIRLPVAVGDQEVRRGRASEKDETRARLSPRLLDL